MQGCRTRLFQYLKDLADARTVKVADPLDRAIRQDTQEDTVAVYEQVGGSSSSTALCVPTNQRRQGGLQKGAFVPRDLVRAERTWLRPLVDHRSVGPYAFEAAQQGFAYSYLIALEMGVYERTVYLKVLVDFAALEISNFKETFAWLQLMMAPFEIFVKFEILAVLFEMFC